MFSSSFRLVEGRVFSFNNYYRVKRPRLCFHCLSLNPNASCLSSIIVLYSLLQRTVGKRRICWIIKVFSVEAIKSSLYLYLNLIVLWGQTNQRWLCQKSNGARGVHPSLINCAAVNVFLLSMADNSPCGQTRCPRSACRIQSRPNSPGLHFRAKPPLVWCLLEKEFFFLVVISGTKSIKKMGPGVMRCLEFTPR